MYKYILIKLGYVLVCLCYVFGMSVCYNNQNVFGMSVLCLCYVFGMSVLCLFIIKYGFGMSVLCLCYVLVCLWYVYVLVYSSNHAMSWYVFGMSWYVFGYVLVCLGYVFVYMRVKFDYIDYYYTGLIYVLVCLCVMSWYGLFFKIYISRFKLK